MNERLKRLVKFSFSALLIYFIVKAPIMFLLTDYLHIHYVLSGAIAGAVLTVLTYIPSEFWVWRKRSGAK